MQCCLVCGRTLTNRAAHDALEERVLEAISSEHPEWMNEDGRCALCVTHYRALLKARISRSERLRATADRSWSRRVGRLLHGYKYNQSKYSKTKLIKEVNVQMKKWKIAALLVGALTVAAVFIGCSLSNSKAETSIASAPATTKESSAKIGTEIGNTAPDFQLAKMDNSPMSLADLRGQPAVLVFWTAWCPVCKEEAPHFNQLAAQYEPKGVRVLGININDSLARAESGIKEFGIRYAVARDADASVTHRYKVAGTPTIIFLDRNGVVRYFGNELPADYPARLDALLAGKE